MKKITTILLIMFAITACAQQPKKLVYYDTLQVDSLQQEIITLTAINENLNGLNTQLNDSIDFLKERNLMQHWLLIEYGIKYDSLHQYNLVTDTTYLHLKDSNNQNEVLFIKEGNKYSIEIDGN